jgi:lipopolysaccharide export system permease protein
LEILQHQEISTLDGFNPTMINNLYNKKNLSSILDAIKTLIVLREQGVDTKRHRIVIYQYGLIPWVSPAIILIIFFYLPYTPRIGRMALFSFFAIFSSVVTFGFFVSITEIAQKINVLPEIMIVLPVFLIMLIALYKYIKLV